MGFISIILIMSCSNSSTFKSYNCLLIICVGFCNIYMCIKRIKKDNLIEA